MLIMRCFRSFLSDTRKKMKLLPAALEICVLCRATIVIHHELAACCYTQYNFIGTLPNIVYFRGNAKALHTMPLPAGHEFNCISFLVHIFY